MDDGRLVLVLDDGRIIVARPGGSDMDTLFSPEAETVDTIEHAVAISRSGSYVAVATIEAGVQADHLRRHRSEGSLPQNRSACRRRVQST